jgi:hypothetical protein
MRSEIDHLVVACADLDQGSAWALDVLGVAPQPGGRHLTMGTHNRLLKLGPRAYLELIALDPEGSAPARPRWFSLDDPAVRARAAQAPFLLTWVAATDDLLDAVTRVPLLGEPVAFTRQAFSWRLTLPDDGALPFGGVLPTVLQWSGPAHPCDVLPDNGCTLQALQLEYPAADSVLPLFRELRVSGPVELKSGPKRLVAQIDSPRGRVALA